MELYIIGFCMAVCGTWLYLAKDYQHTKFASSQLKMILNQNLELQKRIRDQEETINTLRSTFLSYKSNWQKDIFEVQNSCQKISESQLRVSKSQREILGKMNALPIQIMFTDNTKSQMFKSFGRQ